MIMADFDTTERRHDGAVRTAISDGMVALLKDYYGVGPTQAKTYHHDDLVVCLMRGGFTRVERTLMEVGRSEHEDLADHVGVLLVAAHEPHHPPAGGRFDDRDEAVAHDVLELHALLDDRRRATALQQGPLHARRV